MNHTATYSPEDNKLRLYPAHRLSREDYEKIRAAGFRWAPKQELFVCPRWTPAAEDALLELVDEIGDEDYSPEERAADRAERFAGYRDKRRAEAHGHADTFQAGPAAFGHQSQARAERQAARHDRHRTRSLSQWSKAEYWQERTKAVIAHALHRSSASVRRGRLLRLESEFRRYGHISDRWKQHYELRIGYEKAMLEAEGGMAAEVEIEPGGFFGRYQVQSVNRSPVTGRVVSVKVYAPKKWYRGEGEAPMTLQSVNIERLGADAYRAPTDEEREAFKRATAERKAKEKASKPKSPSLINPTDEDAERLQAVWNQQAQEIHKKRGAYGEFKPSEVRRMTQAEYSAASKGTYSKCKTVDISEKLVERRHSAGGRDGRVTVFKIRKSSNGFDMYAADRVIVITDKPQKSIPWAEVEKAKAAMPTADKLFHRLEELNEILRQDWIPKEGTPESALLEDARYIGWVYVSSMSQFGWNDSGIEAYRKYQEIVADGGRVEEHGVTYSLAAVAAARG